MQASAWKFFRELLETPGPSGYEGPVQAVFEKYVEPYADELRRFRHGSVAAIRNPQGSPRVIVTGHADEIGLIVHHIDDNGFLYVRPIGGIDLVTLPGARVDVHTASGVLPGVIGRKPTHLQESDERRKVGKIKTAYVDIGAADKAAASECVRPGDTITFAPGVTRLGDKLVSSKATDNRTGVFCAAEALRLVSEARPEACVIALSTVCEEIGGEGALTSAYDLEPDVAIVIDVTFATDQPDVSGSDTSELSLGKGPVLARGPRLNETVVDLLGQAAEAAGIEVQYEVVHHRTGTDGDLFYRSRGGVPIAVIGVPCRYMHTPAEVVSVEDLDAIAQLVSRFAFDLREGQSFDPFGQAPGSGSGARR